MDRLEFHSILELELPENFKPLVEIENLFDHLDSSNIEKAGNRISELLEQELLKPVYVSEIIYNELDLKKKKSRAIADLTEYLITQKDFELEETNQRSFNHYQLVSCMNVRGVKCANSYRCLVDHESFYNVYCLDTIEYDAAWDNIEGFQEKYCEKEDGMDNEYINKLARIALKYGSVNVVKFILLNGVKLKNSSTKCAVKSGNFELIHILENIGLNFDNLFTYAVLLRHNEIGDWLIQNYEIDLVSVDYAIQFFNVRAAHFLIENNCFDDGPRIWKGWGFQLAIRYQCRTLVMTLVEKYGHEINEINVDSHNCVVSFAAKNKDYELLDLLMGKKADITCFFHPKDHTTWVEDLPILIATETNDMKLFKYCIEHAPIGDIWDKDNNYPLLHAVKNKSKEMVKILLDLGANPNHECNLEEGDKDFPITAARVNDIDILKMLFEHGASLYPDTNRISLCPIYFAVMHGNKEMMNLILEHDDDQCFCKLLPFAADIGNSEIIKYILSIDGANVNEKDFFGNTALINASWHNRKTIVELLLLEDDVDVNAKNDDNETALICATKQGNLKIVELLLDVDGIDVNAKNNHNETALICATKQGNLKIVHLLLSVDGIDVNEKDDLGNTALMYASYMSKRF